MKKNFADRFWEKVVKAGASECWMWSGAKHRAGYGMVNVRGKAVTASRVAYELAVGPIPPGLHALHKCDVPGCCNPAHIYPGDNAQNMADKVARNRQRKGPHSAETIEKIKIGRAANPPKQTAAGRASRAKAMKDRWADPEWRAKFSDMLSGENNPQYGKKPSAARMANIKKANAARRGVFKHSPETREKMRLSALAREAAKRGD